MKILIVEDDPASRRLMLAYLDPLGRCTEAADGHEALAAFTWAHDLGEPFDLICLDIMMPSMTGHEVLKTIRHFEEERDIDSPVKVIMTTALKDRDNVMAAFCNQCEAYLVKPLEREKLLEQIQTLGLTSA